MTVDEQPSAPPARPRTPAELAVDRYLASMRRPRLIYAGVIGLIVVALVVVVGVLWSGSEVAHVSVHTAPSAAPSVALQNPSNPLRQTWQSADETAIGTPYWLGTVVTYSEDSVRGRLASTGAIAWSYTRTDRTVCGVIQDQSNAIAIFGHGGNCDEVTGLDSSTGQRKWTRTLDKDGNPVNGEPTYAVGPFTFLVTTPKVIYAIDPGSGLDRWTFAQPTCTISSAVLGSAGVLISQTCAHPNCDGLKFCAAGTQLLLRDATAGHSDDSGQKTNPDQIKWLLANNTDVPASADQFVSAIDPSGLLLVLDVTKGTRRSQVAIPAGADTKVVVASAFTNNELLWFGGAAYSIELSTSKLVWSAPALSPPTITQKLGQQPLATPDLAQTEATVPSSTGIDELDGATGKVTQSFTVTAPPARSQVFPFGSGFLVAGAMTTMYQ